MENIEPVKIKLSDKYRGILTREEGQQLNNHISQMRKEWNNINCVNICRNKKIKKTRCNY